LGNSVLQQFLAGPTTSPTTALMMDLPLLALQEPQLLPAAGQLAGQDLFHAPPKGDFFAGQHNQFPSNISLLGPPNNNTVPSYYVEKQQQQQQQQQQHTQVQSPWTSSVLGSRTWPCQARGSDEEHKRVSNIHRLSLLSMIHSCMFFL
jgi:hypothetical protein